MEKAYLVLENGEIYEGYGFGAIKESVGELVFNTDVCGYMETLTDPANYGQIVIQTFPMIGNYGVNAEDVDGRCVLNGYVVREWCDAPSNFRCETDIDTYLKNEGIPGIYGVDTRRLTSVIRENGVMNAAICYEVPEDIGFIKDYKISNLIESTVDAGNVRKYDIANAKYSVALIDFGVKTSLIEALNNRGCDVTVYPYTSQLLGVLTDLYDGIVLSNGSGAPDEMGCIEQIGKLFGIKPILAIGLGCQLLAVANGASATKLKHGHRGANQPSKHLASGRTYITNQNHGYSIDANSLKAGTISFVNVNDNTLEGILYEEGKAVSVMFYPDSENGTAFVYDEFINMMGGAR